MKNGKYFKKNKEIVHNMFDYIAKDYDRMNGIISFGKNLIIKRKLLKNIPIKPDSAILDICTGTGDIAILASKYLNGSGHIIGVDFSEKMLEIAAKKAKGIKNIKFIQADALNLPFENETFDICFISYGLRNLVDLKKGILEIKRVTKKGGYMVNLDMGKPKGLINDVFRLYFFYIVPLLGKIFFGDESPYNYLPRSCQDFPSQEGLAALFKELGFGDVKNYDFAFGSVAGQIAKL